MDEQMIECLDAHEAALSGLVDKLFAAGAREAGLLVSQASATVGSLAQEIRAAHSVMSARLAELEEALDMLCDSVEREDELNGSISGALMADVREARAALAPHPKGTDQ